MRELRWIFLFLFCSIAAHAAPLSGRLAYVQNGSAYVMTLPNGKPLLLPQSRNARIVSIAPVGGTILYFVPKSADASEGERVMMTRPPYKVAQSLKLPEKFDPWRVQWTGDGKRALLVEWDKSFLWTPAYSTFKRLPGGDVDLSRDGKWLAYAGKTELRVREVANGKERLLFSTTKPQPLLEAFKRARHPKNLKDLTDTVSPDLWKDSEEWRVGSCVFAEDNSRLFWACNAGVGAGAAGNTTWCWFATDLKTGRIAVLSKVGAQYSRLPSEAQLAPGGQKLVYAASIHASAIENPVSVSILDLLTQKETYLEGLSDFKKYDTNLISGLCWSSDGRAVAASAYYYKLDDVAKIGNWQPRNNSFTLYIRDLSNRTLKKIPGAVSPSWGR